MLKENNKQNKQEKKYLRRFTFVSFIFFSKVERSTSVKTPISVRFFARAKNDSEWLNIDTKSERRRGRS